MHHIQKSVINVLASTDPAHYADLKPRDMDGNQFTYHLKQLIVDKLVIKNDDGMYSLSQTGRAYLVHRYEDDAKAAHTIFLVVIRHGNQLLMRERLIQPSLGYSGFIHGEPTLDMSLQDAITARVLEKTGLSIANVAIHGSGLIRLSRDQQPESYSHAIIATIDVESTELPIVADETGRNFWINRDDITTIPKLLPSCYDILQLIDNPTVSGWFDLAYDLQ